MDELTVIIIDLDIITDFLISLLPRRLSAISMLASTLEDKAVLLSNPRYADEENALALVRKFGDSVWSME